MNRKIYNILLILTLSVLFFTVFKTAFAVDLLLNYPNLPGATTPVSGQNQLTDIIKYIYIFALGISGIVALISILLGAIRYIMSAGNPSKAGDAKDQIFSAILGLLLLMGSVLILRTINPDLVSLNLNTTITATNYTPQTQGSYLYKCLCCWYSSPATSCNPTASTRDLSTGIMEAGPVNTDPWGNSECKSFETATAASQCQQTCKNIFSTHSTTSSRVVLCQ